MFLKLISSYPCYQGLFDWPILEHLLDRLLILLRGSINIHRFLTFCQRFFFNNQLTFPKVLLVLRFLMVKFQVDCHVDIFWSSLRLILFAQRSLTTVPLFDDHYLRTTIFWMVIFRRIYGLKVEKSFEFNCRMFYCMIDNEYIKKRIFK